MRLSSICMLSLFLYSATLAMLCFSTLPLLWEVFFPWYSVLHFSPKTIIQFIWLFCSHGFITLIDLLEEHLSHAWYACDKNKLMINNDIDDDDNNWQLLSEAEQNIAICRLQADQ